MPAEGLDPALGARDFDAERRAIHDLWESAAAGWARRREAWGEQSGPVADWLVEAIDPAPGLRVLDLAAGLGEVGFRALPRILPGGALICSDQAPAMIDRAREHARELALDERAIEFRELNGEWIDLEVASVDRVLCRWGYMLMADPAAALRETRRVLRSGGRVALAVWDAREHNPWSAVPGQVLLEHGLGEPFDPRAPGPFALHDVERLRGMLEEAGFAEIAIDDVEIVRSAPSFAEWWAIQLDLSVGTRTALAGAGEEQARAVEAEVAARFAPYTGADGRLAVPGRTHVAVAEA